MKYLAILLIILISIAAWGFFYYEEKLFSKKQGLENAKNQPRLTESRRRCGSGC